MEMEGHIHIARLLTNILENQFSIAGYRIGLDPIMGFIPGVGDVIPVLVSIYIVWIALKVKMPYDKIAQMIGNNFLEFILGLFPVIGGIADNVYKANTRNMNILEKFSSQVIEGQVVQ